MTFDKIIFIRGGWLKQVHSTITLVGEAHIFWPKGIPVCAAEHGMWYQHFFSN